MAGLETAMERHLTEVASRYPSGITYLEIGVAAGATLTAMASIAKATKIPFRAIGIDLKDGYSLHLPTMARNAARCGLSLNVIESPSPGQPGATSWGEVTVFLCPAQLFLARHWAGDAIHFALIDGCHGKPCVMADFNLVSRFVPSGGIVAFHDFGEDSVGEPQPHCGLGDTLGACRDLGLLDGSLAGWKHIDTVVGTKALIGRDLGVFQRT